MQEAPKLLLLESSTPTASVALAEGDTCVASLRIEVEKGHARLLAPMIQEVLGHVRWTVKDLSALVISAGPGSYTGLRVGVSTLKGMAVATGIPMIGINSLEALAGNVLELASELNASIIPMTDARRMEVYLARYSSTGEELNAPEAKIMEEWSLSDWLEEGNHLLVGNGVEKCRSLFSQYPGITFLPGQAYDAEGMIPAALRRWEAGKLEDTEAFEPLYLKSVRITKSKRKLFG